MEPILAILDIDKEMRVEADTSDYTTGEILLTKYEDRKWRLVALSQTSFGHISTNSSTIPTVSKPA